MVQKVKLNNGVEMPMEGFGVFQIPDTQCEQIVLEPLKPDIVCWITASSYKNEEVVGSAVKKAISTGVVNEKNCLLPLRHIFSRWDMKRLYRLFMSR